MATIEAVIVLNFCVWSLLWLLAWFVSFVDLQLLSLFGDNTATTNTTSTTTYTSTTLTATSQLLAGFLCPPC